MPLRRARGNPDFFGSRWTTVNLTPSKVRDIILFAVKCARNPQSMTEADYASLHGHGLNDEDIMELISVIGLAVYLNIVADATGVTPDDMFFRV
jgi:alkylhydroperoxidase family enzyme